MPADERCAGVSRRVSSHDGVYDDALTHAEWMGCSTLPAPELAGRRKVSTDKLLRRTLKRCASPESPLGNPPVGRIQPQCEPKVRRKKEEAGIRVSKEERREVQPPNFVWSILITACCLAMTWACQTKAMDIKLIEKMHKARISPICVSEAGTPNTRRIQAIWAPKNSELSEHGIIAIERPIRAEGTGTFITIHFQAFGRAPGLLDSE